MAKRERLEDLGVLTEKLRNILAKEIFEFTESKHGYEDWVRINYDKIEYDEPRGLEHIFYALRGIEMDLNECLAIALGDSDE